MADEQQNITELKRTRGAKLAQLTKLYKDLEKNMLSYENAERVTDLYDKLGERYEQFKSAHLECLDAAAEPDVTEQLEVSFKSCQHNFHEFRERISQWIANSKSQEEKIPDDDVCSTVSRVTSLSTASSRSSASKLKSAKAKRLVAEHKLQKLKEKQELERARNEIEMKQRLLEQEAEIEEAKIEESVWMEDITEEERMDTEVTVNSPTDRSTAPENSNINSKTQHMDRIMSEQQHVPVHAIRPAISSELQCGSSIATVPSIDTAFERLASSLHEGFNLPKPELFTFSGNPMDYCKFMKNFETNIEAKVSDNQQRLSYLIQYCVGEAKNSIEDCVLLDTNEGYNRARSILFSRYGRPHVIARSYVEKLVYGAQIKASDVEGLSKLSLEMQKCEITLSKLGFSSDIDNSENLRRIVKRLPMHLRVKWVDVAHSITESGREPRFKDLSRFIEQKSHIAASMYSIDLTKEKFDKGNKKHDSSVKVSTYAMNNAHAELSVKPESTCLCCKGTCRYIEQCTKFKSMSLVERTKLVSKLKLCFNCLKGKHFAKDCRKPKACTVIDCCHDFKHHLLLHNWVKSGVDNAATKVSINCSASENNVKNCLGIIPVVVKGSNGNTCSTYALIDDGADKTLCDRRLIEMLETKSRPVTFHMTTATAQKVRQEGREVDLQVHAVNGGSTLDLRKIWSVARLPISKNSAISNKDIKKFPHLSDIRIPEINSNDVLLLIGTDMPAAHIPLEVRSGDIMEPYAVRTRLGWIVRGPISESEEKGEVFVNFGKTDDVILQEQLERLWTTDFGDKTVAEKPCMSVEDKRALSIMESTTVFEDGHYKLGLPWRNDVALPNNFPLAQARLKQLQRKLSLDSKLHEMYTTTMNDYIQKGHAKEVNEVVKDSNRIWYLPHHPVTNEHKPGKVRVVFDCAAKYKDVSLNSQLLQGPDLMNSLIGVIMRFRQEPIALAADIQAMFHQVRVIEEDCDALRFLWWPDGDLHKQPKVYQMLVHLFGATSSPSCAAYALKRTATDNAGSFDRDVAATVERNFYVDDLLKSVDSEDKAVKLASELQAMLKKGGFRLTKWLSNSKAVLNEIPESERAPSVVNLEPDMDLPIDRALGVIWDVNEDTIRFKVRLEEKPITRRGIVSTISSIFDPLGLVSPVTLSAKVMLQDLCRQKLGWDDTLPEGRQEEWLKWIRSLPELEHVSVPRCFKSTVLNISNAQLHIFSDGSETGYGACAYLRLEDNSGEVNCSLVIGKSRLAPLKQSTIPRLELSGAVIACRLFEIIRDELDIKLDSVQFWTDSMIVLGYIRNETRRFKTFVANRLSVIQELTTSDQWHHVDSKSNPADIASRGIHARDSKRMEIWLHGPEFLKRDCSEWPKEIPIPKINTNDDEIKKDVAVHTSTSDPVVNFLNYYSDWTKLRRAVAWLIRYKNYCRHKYLGQEVKYETGNITLSEVRNATEAILMQVQINCFANDVSNLKNAKPVRKDSSIASLNPVMDRGLIRTKGRINYNDISDYPIILPGNHHVTDLIIRFYHETHGHVGRQQVLATIRRKYWIIKGSSTVKKVITRCIQCKRQSSPLCSQQMAPLLKEQITADKPPFTYVGVDYFGPLIVKSGRSHVKRYGCLFTCLASRAVHIEIAHSLTTNSFIAAFQRFISRRGVPEKVYSDNGSNLVSGDHELRKSIQEWNKSNISKYMVQQDIEWQFNPPAASHRGGAWERIIRSARTILKSLVKEQILMDEGLLTLMAEVEKILNDRPLTPVSDDTNDLPVLTPNMLLLMKSNTCLPQGIFNKQDIYARRWWKQVQYLANIFWRRWIREYVSALQARTKWQRPRRNMKEGDVVLVAQENLPRGQWPLGRVVRINTGRDGLVRSCVVKTRTSEIIRPITRLCLLECEEF